MINNTTSYIKNRSGKIRIHNPEYTRPFNVFLVMFAIVSMCLMLVMPFDWLKLIGRAGNIGEALSHLMVLDLSDIDLVAPFFFETLCVAVLSTVYSAILGMFLAVFMAKNITPYKLLPPVFTAVFTFVRAVPDFIWALLVLVCLGFGPATGILGLAAHSTAFFVMSFAHSYEEVESGTLEALEATGANRVKVFFSAVLPSTLTSIIAWFTMRFETSFQSATILGMVGAGGIGQIIVQSFRAYKYGMAWVSVFIVVVFTYIFEISFNSLKQKIRM